MSYEANEISGCVNALVLAARKAELAINEGWAKSDTMLTPTKVVSVSRSLAEAKRTITRAQEAFKKFEGVAEARKIAVVV